MNEYIKVAVKSDDVVLRDPKNGERITTKGTRVKKTAFWTRRLRDGDAILVVDKPIVKERKDSKDGSI